MRISLRREKEKEMKKNHHIPLKVHNRCHLEDSARSHSSSRSLSASCGTFSDDETPLVSGRGMRTKGESERAVVGRGKERGS